MVVSQHKTATRFGLIRHGQTLWNAEKRIQGRDNSPLSACGREMARTWGRQLAVLPWERMLMSDLGRVQETGQLVNATLHLPVFNDSRLREQDWGEWSGWTFPDLFTQQLEEVRRQEQRGWEFTPPGGESRQEVLYRSCEALLDAHKSWPGENIIVVCHEGIIKSLLYSLHKRKFLPSEPKLLKKGYQLHLLQACCDEILLEQVNALELDSCQ
jgi:probable phosphoglycerate mutase